MQQTIIDPFGLLSSASDNNFKDAFVDAINLNKVESVATDPVNNWLVVTYIDGTISNLNLDDVVTDIYVDGATLDAITNVLTLTNSQGGADVVVNLSDFINSSEFITGQALKVDKVVGKQLSTEDYSTAEKDKLVTIEDGATADQTDLEIEALYEGLADTNKFSDVDKQSILNNTQAIANLATAQCQIHNDDTTIVTTSNQVLSFATNIGSTDEDVFSVDDSAETITFYKNASYNFSSTVTFDSSTNLTRTIYFDLINTADDSVIATEMAIMSTNNGDTEIANIITLLTIGRNGMPPAPCTIRIEVRADGDGYSIPVFHSILASSSSYDVTTNASGISVVPVGDIESINVQDALEELDTEKFSAIEGDYLLDILKDRQEPTGFVRENPDYMGIIEFCVDGTKVISVDQNGVKTVRNDGLFATGTSFEQNANALEFVMYPLESNGFYRIYVNSVKFDITTLQKATFTNTAILQFAYHDADGVLLTATGFTEEYFLTTPITATLYYNPNATVGLRDINFGDERHGTSFTGLEHYVAHFTDGTRYINGMAIDGLVAGGTTFSQVTAGVASDEDIIMHPVTQATAPTIYLEGTQWFKTADTNTIAHLVGGVAQYNPSGVLSDVTGNDAMIVFFVLTNNVEFPYVKIPSQEVYADRNTARANIESAWTKISLAGLPSPEFLPIGALIVRDGGDLQELSDGSLYYDLRKAKLGGAGTSSGTTTSHRDLLDRDFIDSHPISAITGLQIELNSKSSKNILINPNNTVNQRGFNGDWDSIAIGEYGFDRWRKWDTTQKVQPIIEGNYIPSTVYTLSNNGVFVATLTSPASGIWNVIVLQTYNNLQLEEGTKVTNKEFRHKELEEALCYAYFEKGSVYETLFYCVTNAWPTKTLAFKKTKNSTPNVNIVDFGLDFSQPIYNNGSTVDILRYICPMNQIPTGAKSADFVWTADAEVY